MTSSSDDSMQPDAGTKVLAKMRTQVPTCVMAAGRPGHAF